MQVVGPVCVGRGGEHDQGLRQLAGDLKVCVDRADGVAQVGPVAIKPQVEAVAPVRTQPGPVQAGRGSFVCPGRSARAGYRSSFLYGGSAPGRETVTAAARAACRKTEVI